MGGRGHPYGARANPIVAVSVARGQHVVVAFLSKDNRMEVVGMFSKLFVYCKTFS